MPASFSLFPPTKTKNHSFLAGSSDSDSDEDRRVVLKSARDKRLAELHDTVDEIRVSRWWLFILQRAPHEPR
jgi:hypothetical protein